MELIEKVPCTLCGTLVLPRTAEKNGGLCMPCREGRVQACSRCGKRTVAGGRGTGQPTLCPACLERERPTEIDEFIRAHGSGDCSLLSRLFHLDERLRREGQNAWIGWGLIDPPERYPSGSTPKNAIAFADAGGDDIHFSLVSWRGRVSDASAVVLTVPEGGGHPREHNLLVGQSLYEFLCLGFHAGFDPVNTLLYDWESAVKELENGLDPDEVKEDQLETLRIYREELQLKPWPDVDERLKELQKLRGTVLRF